MNARCVRLLTLLLFLLPGCDSSPLAVGGATASLDYSVPQRAHVKLWIENSYSTVMGTYVDTLQEAGRYRVSVSISGWPSGIYFSVVQEADLSGRTIVYEERRMLLVNERRPL